MLEQVLEMVQVFEVVCRNLVGGQELVLVGQITLKRLGKLTLSERKETLTKRKTGRSSVALESLRR